MFVFKFSDIFGLAIFTANIVLTIINIVGHYHTAWLCALFGWLCALIVQLLLCMERRK